MARGDADDMFRLRDHARDVVRRPERLGQRTTGQEEIVEMALVDGGRDLRLVGPQPDRVSLTGEQIREGVSAQRGRKGVFCPEALQVRP